MIPTALTCSLAFVLPVSTPPNAMAFASGRLRVAEMVRLGLVMNAIGILAILLALYTIGARLFLLDAQPVPSEWRALPPLATTTASGSQGDAAAAHS